MSALYDNDFEYTELGMKEEREYFAKKMRYLQFQAFGEDTGDEAYREEMRELRKEIDDYERLYEDEKDEEGEHVDDAFDYEMRAHQEMYDASVIEDARISLARDAEMRNFIVHQKNVGALAKYYDAVAIGTQCEDAEYEFWLVFEIQEYEAGTSEYVADVEVAQYGTMQTIPEEEEEEDDDVDRTNWSYQDYDDEQDRMEQHIENKRADALDDADMDE